MEKQALLNVARLAGAISGGMAKTASPVGATLRGMLGSVAGALKPSDTLRAALAGAGRSAGNTVAQAVKSAPERFGPHAMSGLRGAARLLGNGVLAGDLRRGLRQMNIGMHAAGGVRQGLFNAGLKNAVKGVGKSGLVYGGALYGGSRLAGSGDGGQG